MSARAAAGLPDLAGFLRYARLDELPKLINVLDGDIDLTDFRD
jgi:lipopolysaccharide/colanic/teichoic acid biosynthesis glycosyltransferase